MAGIYIHIPYCKQKCSYCNFHFSTNLQGLPEMQHALLQEIDLRAEEITAFPTETIYLGGGTPSLWSPGDINALYAKITSIAPRTELQEMTIECNPDDLTPEYLTDLKNYTPVQRISIGIQSFHDDDLRLMNRSHDAHQARKALENIFSVGFSSVSADLIFGLPDSTVTRWLDNITALLHYPVDHISCYNLTIEERTALHYQILKGKTALPEDELVLDQFYAAKDHLTRRGFIHYEISNYGLPDNLAVHNTNYWKNQPYVGIGPSAHSYDGYRRRWNVADNRKYVKSLREGHIFWESEDLSEADRYNEYIMTGLRTMWGISAGHVERFNAAIRQEFQSTLRHVREKGWILEQEGRLVLSRSGQAVADRIIAEFFFVD